jgi:septal ring factor EnvC (AmiA/AmiB activator)
LCFKAQSEHKLILREVNAKQKAFANQLSGKQQVLKQNQQNMEKQIKSKQQALERQQQTTEQQLKSKLQNLEKQIQALNKQLTKSKSFYIIPCFVVSHAN